MAKQICFEVKATVCIIEKDSSAEMVKACEDQIAIAIHQLGQVANLEIKLQGVYNG